jgi:hypothetical protein
MEGQASRACRGVYVVCILRLVDNGLLSLKSQADKKAVVDGIRARTEAARGTEIWQSYVNALKLIAQTVFTRSSGCILELIQNAEDAGQGIEKDGEFDIRINPTRLKITHNARPFSEDDVRAICGIRSSKKPERGTLGYLGIGFKSAFKLTDRPEIYSNGFQFKFDRNYREWDNPSETPWHVMPIWIDEPNEKIEADKTTFIIPFRQPEHYSLILEDVRKLGVELYLFLHWLKKIQVTDEGTEQSWSLESADVKDGITAFVEKGEVRRFKVFRKEVDVPLFVKQDRLTQEYRANVSKRQIAVAFAIDEQGNLHPMKAGAMYGGVYSFLPLGEASSGAQFPIQADFLVQPGRDAINYEAKWNEWLLGEVVTLCMEAVEEFKKHDVWKFQFLRAFEFTKREGLESYRKLFGPKLIDPLENALNANNCVATRDGGWAKPQQVVAIDEKETAVKSLLALGVLQHKELAPVLGGSPDLVAAHPMVTAALRTVSRWQLLENSEFLKAKAQSPDAASWYRSLYTWLAEYPKMESYRPYRARYDRQRMMGYHKYEFILTTDGSVRKGGDVFLADLPFADTALNEWAATMRESKPVLHSEILSGITDENDRKNLRGFLTGFVGVQLLDGKAICKDALLPKILTFAPKPSPADLIKYTRYCHEILDRQSVAGNELWVLTKQHEVKPAKEVFLSTEFKPMRNWETFKQYVSGICFISPDYLAELADDAELQSWRDFFRAAGVQESPDNGIEDFAMSFVAHHLPAYCRDQLSVECQAVTPVDARNFGYDLSAQLEDGNAMYVEVKGRADEPDIELTDNETRTADTHKEHYYLCVVSGIPERPAMYVVRNPAAIGQRDKLTVTATMWKQVRWQPGGTQP